MARSSSFRFDISMAMSRALIAFGISVLWPSILIVAVRSSLSPSYMRYGSLFQSLFHSLSSIPSLSLTHSKLSRIQFTIHTDSYHSYIPSYSSEGSLCGKLSSIWRDRTEYREGGPLAYPTNHTQYETVYVSGIKQNNNYRKQNYK